MGRRLFLVGVGVVCIACLVAACGGEKPADARAQRMAEVQTVYDAVAAVRTATEAGVSYNDYAELVSTASKALLAYDADEETRTVSESLSAAMYGYQTALRAWATKVDDCPDCAWRKFVAAHPQFTIEDADPEYAVSVLWGTAKTQMNAAREALTALQQKKS